MIFSKSTRVKEERRKVAEKTYVQQNVLTKQELEKKIIHEVIEEYLRENNIE